MSRIGTWVALCLAICLPALAQSSFVNWETPHVSPIALTPDGSTLLAVNTPDNRLMVYDVTSGSPVLIGTVPVGLDPVSVRARSNRDAWVVNQVSDSVSIVDLVTMNVRRTLRTADEPADVVFAGNPQRAFVSCSQANQVMVFDPADLDAPPVVIPIEGEDPRAMAVNAAGTDVYVAIFESGNDSTVLGGGGLMDGTVAFPPNVVNDPNGPHGGANPPPNTQDPQNPFNPPMNATNPQPPRVSLIVKKDVAGRWMDDNLGDWTDFVSGSNAAASGRRPGWDLVDHDVAIIDAATLSVRYATGLMNLCMALAVDPASGRVTVVGTDGINEIRFEPVVNGRFTRVNLAFVDAAGPSRLGVVDLNPHLTYMTSTIPQAERDRSIGDSRGIAWNQAGTRAYVTGMGSNNLVVIDATGGRAGLAPTIPVGEGPTGIVLDEARSRLYVLNKFEASLSVVDVATEAEIARVPFFDPSPAAIKRGRKHLYDTRKNSGLGHIACASCHVDARMDGLAWDLGNPAGEMKPVTGQNLGMGLPGLTTGFEPWHPMKGPMTTQTLQDIIGKEPHHWRGDRDGLEEFNGAFIGLQGDDANLTATEMQEYEDFLATIHFPPNPFRNFDNTLPTNLPLPGHYTTGRFGPAGMPLQNGNAVQGLAIYRPPRLLDANALACVTCHTLPIGIGTDMRFQNGQYRPIAPGPNGERHHALVSVDGVTNVSMKIPQLRNLYEKVGFEATQLRNTRGFGLLHDGSVDSIARFVTEPVFTPNNEQEVANLVAFMLAFSGSDLPAGSVSNPFEPPGTASRDTHAAVGAQTTIVDGANVPPGQAALLTQMINLASAGRVGLVVKGRQERIQRGYAYVAGMFQSDRAAEALLPGALRALASPGSELTYTVVPRGSEIRIGIDQDLDGFYDRDEIDAGSDPADPSSTPLTVCRAGNINAAAGPIADVLLVNGTAGSGPERVVNVSPTTPFTLRIERAPSAGRRYAVYAWVAVPGMTTWRAVPFGVGTSCMPTPLSGGTPQPVRIANTIGFPAQLGQENWPGPPTQPAPYTLINAPAGIGRSVTVFLQGILIDTNAPNGQAGVTNGVLVISG